MLPPEQKKFGQKKGRSMTLSLIYLGEPFKYVCLKDNKKERICTEQLNNELYSVFSINLTRVYKYMPQKKMASGGISQLTII